ncbi:MAG TPA: hypothetical protein VJP79_03900, partial [Nitrososphaera sp.]|nr:hypothetical protein [Nitrososphaera sp.]
DLVSKPRIRLYRRDVRVDKYAFDTLFRKGFEALRTGVVELAASFLLALACFSDFYCPAPEHKDFFYCLISWRFSSLLSFC